MADFYTGRQRGTWYPIILETPEHIIIEGTPHDKASLNPTFLQGLFAGNINNVTKILTNKYWSKWYSGAQAIADASSTKNDGGQGLVKNVWVSEYDPGEFFVFIPNANNYMYRVKSSDLTLKNVVGDHIAGVSYYNGRQTTAYIFNETPDRIDCIYNTDGSGASSSYYYDWMGSFYISKTNMSPVGGCFSDYGGNHLQVLGQDATYTYFAYIGPFQQSSSNNSSAPYANGGRIRIVAVHRANYTATWLLDFYGDTFQFCNGPSVPFQDATLATKKHFYTTQARATAGFFYIRHCWYDEASPTINKGYEDCILSLSGTGFTAGDFTGITGSRYTLLMRNTVVTNNVGQKFLTMTLTNTANWNTSGTSEPLTSFKTWVFKIESDNKTLTPTQIFQHDDRMYDMIPLNDSHTRVMWIFPFYLAFAVWNNSTSSYEIVNKVAVNARSVGVDELDRIWVCDYNNKIQLMTPFVPAKVVVDYELDEYNYQGTDISTHINVSAYDAYGDRIIANVTLTIEGGNCLFGDGSTKKTVTTVGKANGDSDLQVPITILNAGYFRILANTEV